MGQVGRNVSRAIGYPICRIARSELHAIKQAHADLNGMVGVTLNRANCLPDPNTSARPEDDPSNARDLHAPTMPQISKRPEILKLLPVDMAPEDGRGCSVKLLDPPLRLACQRMMAAVARSTLRPAGAIGNLLGSRLRRTAELSDRNENDPLAFYASLLITIRQREGRRCS